MLWLHARSRFKKLRGNERRSRLFGNHGCRRAVTDQRLDLQAFARRPDVLVVEQRDDADVVADHLDRVLKNLAPFGLVEFGGRISQSLVYQRIAVMPPVGRALPLLLSTVVRMLVRAYAASPVPLPQAITLIASSFLLALPAYTAHGNTSSWTLTPIRVQNCATACMTSGACG